MVNKALAAGTLILCLISVGLTVGALHTPDWVSYEGPDGEDFTYGLFMCTDCPDGRENTSWDCVKKVNCEREDEASGDAAD
jgi:hypothetical protein